MSLAHIYRPKTDLKQAQNGDRDSIGSIFLIPGSNEHTERFIDTYWLWFEYMEILVSWDQRLSVQGGVQISSVLHLSVVYSSSKHEIFTSAGW